MKEIILTKKDFTIAGDFLPNNPQLAYYLNSRFHKIDEPFSVKFDFPIESIPKLLFAGTKIASIEFPSSVTKIDAKAFTACDNLQSIVIPDQITSINSSAFAYCGNLESVTLPKKLRTIKSHCFTYCLKLKKINFPSTLKTIGDCAFYHCESLKPVLPDSITNIKIYAFAECDIDSIKLPNKLKKIENGAFLKCKLKEVEIPSSITHIGFTAFPSTCNVKVKMSKENFLKNIKDTEALLKYCDNFSFNKSLDEIILSNTSIENIITDSADNLIL